MRILDLPHKAAVRALPPQHSWIDMLLHSVSPRGLITCDVPEVLHTRIARLSSDHAAAEELVRRRYAWRGYCVPVSEDGEERHHVGFRTAKQGVTLLAEAEGQLLATLRIGPDGRQGLLACGTYAKEIERLRRAGHRLGEITRLAIEKGVHWKGALDALVRGSWLVTRFVHALTDVVIEVNPRHVRFYERVFGFSVLASGGICARVGAPSVLLLLDLEQFGRRIGEANIIGNELWDALGQYCGESVLRSHS